MGAIHATSNGGPLSERGQSSQGSHGRSPFPRYEERATKVGGWVPVDMGGHEVVSRLALKLRAGRQAAAEARHALDRLQGTINDAGLDVMRLLVTELVTNSVRHAGGDDGNWIELNVDIYANSVRAEVVDTGPGFDPPDTPEPHEDRPGGWGLCLVDSLSDRWGVGLDRGTRVWFELDRSRDHFPSAA